MWVKKCWKFLFCADEKMKIIEAKNQNPKKENESALAQTFIRGDDGGK